VTEAKDPGLAALVAKIARERGFGCESYKENCLRRRVAVRMRARAVHTYAQYAAILDADAGEYERLLDALTINVTKFYRNRETWDELARRHLPALWEQAHGRVRCWSAGCASGEEAYTLAMLVLDHARRTGSSAARASVDASDYDRRSLDLARAGCYREAAFEELPTELRAAYVTGTGESCVTSEVKERVRFHRQDLTRDPPPGAPYDLILCRNVVIYFDRPTQERLFAGFAEALRPGGRLVLGKVETLFGPARSMLRMEDPRERIYARP
jgi:chemotaxis methyl-accepting protein methylase